MGRMATESTTKEHAMTTTAPKTLPEQVEEIIRQADAHADAIGEAGHRMIFSYATTAHAEACDAGKHARMAERSMEKAQDQMTFGVNATNALADASHHAQKAAQAYTAAMDAFTVADRIPKASMA